MILNQSAHGDKLNALLGNEKLPHSDLQRVKDAINRYTLWREEMQSASGDYEDLVSKLVKSFNSYSRYISIDLIFDSPNDFLYRQKGQLKLDNTIIEEFLPILVNKTLLNKCDVEDLTIGPTSCFSGVRFESGITNPEPGGGIQIRQKDQDFAISRKLYIQTSHNSDFTEKASCETHIAYIAVECKTNLDKTMFQEAAATSIDIKNSVPGAKYFLLCEWIDMTPISTSTTAIDEIIILRKAKRISSNIRSKFSTYEGRKEQRDYYVKHIDDNPYTANIFLHLLSHIKGLIETDSSDEVITRGYF